MEAPRPDPLETLRTMWRIRLFEEAVEDLYGRGMMHGTMHLSIGSGPYYALYRPYHLASIEAHLSIGEAVIDHRPSFQSRVWKAEVTAKTKYDLAAGTQLEGIGGRHVHGFTLDAGEAAGQDAVPIALVAGSRLRHDVPAGTVLTYDDIELDERRPLVAMRRLQDALLAKGVIGR